MRWQCLLQRLRGWIPLALLCVSCSSGSFILVETLPPVGTASLQVVADLVMSPAKEVPDIPVRASDTASSFTFILALPGSATGRSLQIQVGARDKRGCLIATGSAQRDPSLQVDAVPKVEVPLSLLPAPVGCGGETPTITKVNPPTAPMNASTAVHIDGWALRAPFVVQVDGTRAPHLPSSMDPADVTVSASNRPGPTLLEVTDPFGATARSTTALSYFLPSIRFGAQNRVVRIANNGSSAPFALADLTGDGKADLAMVDYSVATVALNQGGLGFGAPQIVATSGAQQFNAVAAGDLNGDGRSDLVTLALGGSSSSLIKVLLNQGDGTFPIPRQSTYQTGVPTFDLILTDLDGDGSLDVLSTDEGSNVVELLNQGNGTFQAAPRVFPLGVPVGFVDGQSGPLPGFNGAVGDMDGDGLPDLAALSTMKKAIVIYRNQGAGVFGGAETTLELDLSRLGTAALGQMRGADLNRDGLLDLLVTIGFSHVTLLNPRGGKWPIEDAVLEPGRNPSAIDVNTDGWPDLFVPPLTGGMALSGIYPAIGYGYFSQNPAAAPNLQRYLFGDIDGDGKADMVGLLGGDLLFSLNQSQ